MSTVPTSSLDFLSLFTIILLDLTINFSIKQFFEKTDIALVNQNKKLPHQSTQESFFIFDSLLYKQADPTVKYLLFRITLTFLIPPNMI